MGQNVVFLLSFFLLLCINHLSIARLLPAAKPHHFTISHQVEEQITHDVQPRETPSAKGGFGELLTRGAQDKKIDSDSKEGSEIVESSSSHHVALLKRNHLKDTKITSKPQYFEKDELVNAKNDDDEDVEVMDYQPPHRKTPIHN